MLGFRSAAYRAIRAPAGVPPAALEALLARGVLPAFPLDHVVLVVAGKGGADARITPHIAAQPPAGGVHSAVFQRQHRLVRPGRTQ